MPAYCHRATTPDTPGTRKQWHDSTAQCRYEAKFRWSRIRSMAYKDDLLAIRGELRVFLLGIITCESHVLAARHTAHVKILPPVVPLYISDHLGVGESAGPLRLPLREEEPQLAAVLGPLTGLLTRRR